MFGMLNDLQAQIEHERKIEAPIDVDIEEETSNIFHDLLNEACSELYLDCSEYSFQKLLVKMMHIKVLNDWSNKSFDMMLDLIKSVFPMCSTNVPSSFYEAKRKLCDLGLGYETIHVCKYDYVLYWKEFKDLQFCTTCNESQYNVSPNNKGKKLCKRYCVTFL